MSSSRASEDMEARRLCSVNSSSDSSVNPSILFSNPIRSGVFLGLGSSSGGVKGGVSGAEMGRKLQQVILESYEMTYNNAIHHV